MQKPPSPSHHVRSRLHPDTNRLQYADGNGSTNHDLDCRPTAGADSAPGATAQTALRPDGSPINGSTQVAGKINDGDTANWLHAGLPDATEWQSPQLGLGFSQLLEAMKEPVIVHDSGVIIGFNQRVPDVLGCPAEHLLWRRLSKFISPISLPTLTRWIQASDDYTILVNGVRTGGGVFLLRLEAIASLLCPGGRRVAVVSLAEFGPKKQKRTVDEVSDWA